MGEKLMQEKDHRKKLVVHHRARIDSTRRAAIHPAHIGGSCLAYQRRATEGVRTNAALDSGQEYFSKRTLSLLRRELLMQAKFFKKVTPIKTKRPTSLIKLQDLEDNEISKLLKQGHIEKLEGCSGQLFDCQL